MAYTANTLGPKQQPKKKHFFFSLLFLARKYEFFSFVLFAYEIIYLYRNMCDETRKKESRLSEEYNYSLLWYDARFSIWWEVDEMFRAKDDLLYVVERERERHTEKEKWMYMEKKANHKRDAKHFAQTPWPCRFITRAYTQHKYIHEYFVHCILNNNNYKYNINNNNNRRMNTTQKKKRWICMRHKWGDYTI